MHQATGPPAIRWTQNGNLHRADHGGYQVEIRSDPDPIKPKTITLTQGQGTVIWDRFQSTEIIQVLKVNAERWLRGGTFWPPQEKIVIVYGGRRPGCKW